MSLASYQLLHSAMYFLLFFVISKKYSKYFCLLPFFLFFNPIYLYEWKKKTNFAHD